MPRLTGNTRGSTRSGGFGAKRESPILTLTEAPPFRVRLGGVRQARNAKTVGFAGRMKTLVRQYAAGRKGASRAQAGVGRSAAARIPVRAHPQRVIVKAQVVRHSKYASAKGGAAGALAKHMDYLGRGGVAEDGSRGELFNGDDTLTPEDLKALRRAMVDDRHHFRFIVSPESGKDLDLPTYARNLVTQMERDLGTRLTWVGVAHYDTDEPHLHLLIRGVDDRGDDLVISRNYLSHGMRLQAMELATQTLGPRLPEDIERSVKRDLKADRVTGVDLKIAEQARLHPEGWVTALRRPDGSLAAERQRLQTLTRLQHLESLGMARELTPGVWLPAADFVPQLKQLSIRGDIVKTMHQRMRGLDPGTPMVILNSATPPAGPVVGRVAARGMDEFTDGKYLLLEGRDGTAYHVALGEHSEAPGKEAHVGAVVRIVPDAGRGNDATDATLRQLAAAQQGIYDPAVQAQGLVDDPRLAPGITPAAVVQSHVDRAAELVQRGLIERLPDGRFRIPEDLPQRVAEDSRRGRRGKAAFTVETLSSGEVDAAIGQPGLTWLDQELVAGARIGGAIRVGATAFERAFARALKGRAEQLERWGLGTESGGRFQARAGFLSELYERELRQLEPGLTRFGNRVRVSPGDRFRGRIEAISESSSGPHAVVTRPDGYALIPASPTLAKEVGRMLSLTLGRGRRIGDLESPQPTIRFEVMDLVRKRHLRR